MDIIGKDIDLILSSDIRDAEITDSNINSTDIYNCFMDETKVHDASWGKGSFKRVFMERCCFEELSLSNSAFLYADMGKSAFDTVCFDAGNFVTVSFNGCTFDDAKLLNARMFRSDLSGLEINGCKLDGAIINGIPIEKLLDAYRTLHPDEEHPFVTPGPTSDENE